MKSQSFYNLYQVFSIVSKIVSKISLSMAVGIGADRDFEFACTNLYLKRIVFSFCEEYLMHCVRIHTLLSTTFNNFILNY